MRFKCSYIGWYWIYGHSILGATKPCKTKWFWYPSVEWPYIQWQPIKESYSLTLQGGITFRLASNLADIPVSSVRGKNWESTEVHSRWQAEKRHDKFGKTCLNSKKERKQVSETGKRSLLAFHTRCKYSMETTRSASMSWNWWKVYWFGIETTVAVEGQNVI